MAIALWSLLTASLARFKCGLKRGICERAEFVVLGFYARLIGTIEDFNIWKRIIWFGTASFGFEMHHLVWKRIIWFLKCII